MEKKFKVGDRVRMTWKKPASATFGPAWGAQGTIIATDGAVGHCVEFDRAFEGGHCGHAFGSIGKSGHCWILRDKDLKLVNREKIIIYRNGDTVVAKDVVTGKTAKAVCSKDDTFDFTTGARLAFDRLITPEVEPEHKKKPLLNCKFVVVESSHTPSAIGKVIEVKDGKFACLCGCGLMMPRLSPLHFFEELEEYMGNVKILRIRED